MNQTWRLYIFSALLAFMASQFIHADHLFDEVNNPQVKHSACYVCQSHSAAALETHIGISIPGVSISILPVDWYEAPIVSPQYHQHRVRAPPLA